MTNSQTASTNQLEFLAQKTNITVDEAKNILSACPVIIDPIEDILAIIGVLANYGLKGESFILNLYSSFLDKDRGLLVNPFKKAKEMMDVYELSFLDEKGDFIGIVDAIFLLYVKMFLGLEKRESKQVELDVFKVLFGVENVKQINLLYEGKINDVKQLVKELKEISS